MADKMAAHMQEAGASLGDSLGASSAEERHAAAGALTSMMGSPEAREILISVSKTACPGLEPPSTLEVRRSLHLYGQMALMIWTLV
jgi:hypothetical protein